MDKRKLLLIVAVLVLIWLWLRRKKVVVDLPPPSLDTANDPLLLAFANDPTKYEPAHYTYNVDGSNANVNLGPQGFGFLDNRYIPLFGFVGMAQGEAWL